MDWKGQIENEMEAKIEDSVRKLNVSGYSLFFCYGM